MNLELLRASAGRNEIAVLAYLPRRARGASVVAAHGYSSSKHNLDPLCAFLAGHGYAVFSLDFPGHKLGASGGRLERLDDLVAAMEAAARCARERAGSALYCLGHSMGAMTAILTAAGDPGVAGVVSIATGYGRPTALDALAGRGVSDFRAAYVDGLSLPELVAGIDARLDAALPKLAGRPQLYVAADRDAMVARRSVEELFARAPEPRTLATVCSDHTSAAEHARGDVLQWLNARHPRT